ncbi:MULTISPECIES: hypothetical protein [unclassified Marinobacterium]|uniref:hypothetical protein n=1 Tax=unclassified Marinobacterium TaxID=2644139 RepID=UPI001568D7D5|nr:MULTISPECIES: hypothetical protein [unclassified Marinobacterium]NRP10118.1 hypothetical protein [Marinobacterium sp. xm-g-48]NRP83217.1 hypothetical protein [Marinobacterium sp. xm-d-509]
MSAQPQPQPQPSESIEQDTSILKKWLKRGFHGFLKIIFAVASWLAVWVLADLYSIASDPSSISLAVVIDAVFIVFVIVALSFRKREKSFLVEFSLKEIYLKATAMFVAFMIATTGIISFLVSDQFSLGVFDESDLEFLSIMLLAGFLESHIETITDANIKFERILRLFFNAVMVLFIISILSFRIDQFEIIQLPSFLVGIGEFLIVDSAEWLFENV